MLLGAFVAIADFFIVNVALPTIDADLHPSAAMLQLVVAGYGVPYALMLVLGGRLGDLFGRRRLFMLGVASFTLFSLLCGIAPTATVLIAFRAAQGASAAFMVPQALATIQAATSGHERSRAIGLYGATAGIAAVVGQVAGGADRQRRHRRIRLAADLPRERPDRTGRARARVAVRAGDALGRSPQRSTCPGRRSWGPRCSRCWCR